MTVSGNGLRPWPSLVDPAYTGHIAALLYLATYQTYSILRTGQIDSFLILFTTLGLYGLARHLLLGPAWRWFYVGCAAMGYGADYQRRRISSGADV